MMQTGTEAETETEKDARAKAGNGKENAPAATRGRTQEGVRESARGGVPAREPTPAQEIFVTVSDALEYLFCPRFIFFMHCLGIAQREEKRYKVLKGRELHEIREKVNRDYVRKKLHCTGKEISVYLTSHKHQFKGEVDEVLFLEDGTAAPLDYKYAEYKKTIYRTHKYQAALYGILIKEHFGVEVKKGYVCYTRSNNYVAEIDFKQKDYDMALQIVREILMIIQRGYFPDGTKQKARCVDCTYRNICV
jgi:CRISPR-associated exonuclease Cas4